MRVAVAAESSAYADGLLDFPASSLLQAPDYLPELVGAPPARLHHYFEHQAAATPFATALMCDNTHLSYAELDERANRLAHYLSAHGGAPGTTVGILLERSIDTYVSLLAVLKSGAAFVPIDPSYPSDRVNFIAQDADLAAVISTSKLRTSTAAAACTVIELDRVAGIVNRMPSAPLEVPDSGDQLAYIIYTSGTTGRPKGVAVNHSSITYFLSVCTPIYGVSADDRVYQGMTISFDFSIEEIWPTWIAGAALVAGPTDSRKIGSGLAEFLGENEVTVLYCVPTLLATIDTELPLVHTLIVGGEACPRDLVERWSVPGRRIVNTYGPTETTVTATWGELYPGKPVTIGRPMPGYRICILDEHLKQVAPGETGEICIGGLGVAVGYVNRPELNAAKFVADPFNKDLPHARMYRSGDLGRFTSNGEIEFLGRIDSQVKIRGYRIELGEVEAVILEDEGVNNAIVSTVPVGQPAQDIAAYITLAPGCPPVEAVRERLALELRRRLPVYMVPAYIEVLDSIPMLPSGKADRKTLPEPGSPRLHIRTGDYVAPDTDDERKLAAAWAGIFGREDISVTDDFFLDLGGHSLFAAQAVSRLRSDGSFRHLSVADLYSNPSIRALASYAGQSKPASPAASVEEAAPLRHSDTRVRRAGLIQFGLLYGLLAILGAPFAILLAEHLGEHSPFGVTGWDMMLPACALLLSIMLPVILKWTLIGRFEPGSYPLWGSYHIRWWMVRKSFEYSPLHLLAGSPLMNVYTRLLGAKIGKGVHVSTAQVHLPDLLEIGDGASVGYEVELQPFVIENGRLHQGRIRIGEGAFVGAKAVLLAGAEIGDRARVAEQTLVTRNQKIPAGETWSGSPSRQVTTRDEVLESIEAQPRLQLGMPAWLWAAFGGAFAFLETLPLLLAIPGLLIVAEADRLGGPLYAVAATPLAGLSFVLTTCFVVWFGKRLVMPHARPGIYPVDSAFGLRKWIADRLMTMSLTLTNTLYATLYTAPWLRALGARVGRRSEISTVSHIDPDLLVLGDETFVADLASVGAATYHNGYVALGRTVVGGRTFIGNASVVRSNTQLPENCLIGVQSVAPVEIPQTGTSWLGSPAIFLPRRQSIEGFAESVTYKPSAGLVAYRLFVEFFRIILPPTLLYLLGTAMTIGAVRLAHHVSEPVLVLLSPSVYFTVAISLILLAAGLKWLLIGKYRPRIEPLWAPFVRHSEFITGVWESAVVPMLGMLLTGTPMMAWLLRLFGVKAGRRCTIESTFMTEFDLVHLGNDCSIGRATSLQTHLFEDRVMKMSVLEVGNGCAVDTRAVVLYDSNLGDGARLDALSLAMKGESLPAGSKWRGIPSQLVG
jgi:non-ribosomal peptide synthetase-like protein